jgi:cellulose synthase/poly-beta-1,6-N-acetylglucosamine synthase-like glycosyltransferase
VPAAAIFWLSGVGVAWVYAGYPVTLALAGRWFARPRARASMTPAVSVIVAAHDEAERIAAKVANVRASSYPADRLEVVVASDGSTDATVEAARRGGADVVLELPRRGKLAALNAAAERSSGEILVFTDADSGFERDALARLVSNFADPEVGGVAGNVRRAAADGLGAGEGLYWRYEQWIKRLEDRLGSAVSATGQLYAVRRELFRPSAVADGTDDFVISTQVVTAGRRLAFDPEASVTTVAPESGRAELRRKVRLMNRGLRAAFSLGPLLLPWRGGVYALQVLSHKILRRLVPLFLLGTLASSARLVLAGRRAWWAALAPQVAWYALAALGAVGRKRPWGRRRLLATPYYFCLANAAAAIAVISILRGRRYVVWQPERGDTVMTRDGRARAPSTPESGARGGQRSMP